MTPQPLESQLSPEQKDRPAKYNVRLSERFYYELKEMIDEHGVKKLKQIRQTEPNPDRFRVLLMRGSLFRFVVMRRGDIYLDTEYFGDILHFGDNFPGNMFKLDEEDVLVSGSFKLENEKGRPLTFFYESQTRPTEQKDDRVEAEIRGFVSGQIKAYESKKRERAAKAEREAVEKARKLEEDKLRLSKYNIP